MISIKPRRIVAPGTVTAWVPDRTTPEGQHEQRYKGALAEKPWDYDIEVWIPVLDVWQALPTIMNVLRLQKSVRPFIVLVDTGSTPENFEQIQKLDGNDVEIHSLRFKGVHHPSDFVAAALDLGISQCRTEKIFLTHADVILRRRDFLRELMDLCAADCPGVGYQMSPRGFTGWENVLSHTATCLHMPTIRRIGGAYSLHRLCVKSNCEHKPNSWAESWPDTEQLMSMVMAEHGIEPMLIGTEPNNMPTIDENIYHARSITAAQLYAPVYALKARTWLDAAIEEGQQNIAKWLTEDNAR